MEYSWPLTVTPPDASSAADATGTGASVFPPEDPSKRVRKPYTVSKSRETWSGQEHDKFLEALQLFDRDWKKIEAFVGSKTVIQIRSHAQKYFLKVQKSGSNERVPPPRPKRKAAHPYPQKASKNVAVDCPAKFPFQTASAVFELGCPYNPGSSPLIRSSKISMPTAMCTYDSDLVVGSLEVKKDDAKLAVPMMAPNCCFTSSNQNSVDGINDTGNLVMPVQVMPDFAQVYSFIGSVFDTKAINHLQMLRKMEPITIETVVSMMRNLSINLMSPDFENHRRLLLPYDAETQNAKSCSSLLPAHDDKSKSVIPAG